jgi:ribosomal protein S30
MDEQNTTAPEVKEEQTTEQTTVETEPTVAELHTEKTKSPKPNEVPIARLDKEIQRRKEAEAELKALKQEIEGRIEEADEEDNESEVKKLAQKLERIEESEKRSKLETTFMTHLNKTLENSPEYKDIVNIDVIKALAFNPANANKTYKQLLEEAYGNAVTGRRTIETTTPRGGAKDEKLDVQRARNDTEYRREVLKDPELRKQYNEGLTDRVFR